MPLITILHRNWRFASAIFCLTMILLSGNAHANTESFWGAQEFYTPKEHVRYLLLFPPHYNPRRHYELWLNLHGSPGCASHSIFQYREPAQQQEVFLLAPQGSGWSDQSYDRPDGKKDVYRAWDMRKDKARILEVLDEVEHIYPIANKRIALLGFSAGCEMGWRLLAERPTTFYFFGGVANGFKSGKLPISDKALRRAALHVPHFYAAGKADDFAGPMFARTVRRLRADGFELRTAYPADVGHDLPPVIKTPLLAFMDEVRARQKDEPEPQRAGTLPHSTVSSRRTTVCVMTGLVLVSAVALPFLYHRRYRRRLRRRLRRGNN